MRRRPAPAPRSLHACGQPRRLDDAAGFAALATAAFAAAVFVAPLSACPLGSTTVSADGGSGSNDLADAGPDAPAYPAPATDVTRALGSRETLELVTWNLKNFPCGNGPDSTRCRSTAPTTAALVADVIASMDVDLIAVQEVADTAAFEELVARLPQHDGVLSSHQYSDGSSQKIGFIYRTSVLSAGAPALLFRSDPDFPRPGFQVPFTWEGEGGPVEFLAVSVHLKAGETNEDTSRRRAAMAQMEAYARNLVDGAGAKAIVLLGDFNEDLRDADGREAFAPFRDASRYSIRTQAASDAREASYLPGEVVIDHIVTTAAFNAAFGTSPAQIPALDEDVPSYREKLSDHLPVVVVGNP